MPDKLTDKEIVKALTICSTKGASCKDCPAFVKVDRSNCKQVLLGAIDFINRLQVENERLIEEIHQGNITTETQMRAEKQYQWQQLERIKRAKAEAYKEFADKLKLHAYHECDITGYRYLVVQIEEIDNLLKELVGDSQ